MKLRAWQAECIQFALKKYTLGGKHFLVLATPGAGKTIMASALSKAMLEQELIDLVICFSPSSVVCIDFSQTLKEVVGERFDGLLGSKGQSLTYQSMQYLDDDFWTLFQKYRVLAIFDEIHHCSGSNIENANAWGEQILLNVQNCAEFTIALTGTPWRSDTAPIALSQYSNYDNKIHCDYVYGLSEAIKDSVCRIPQIIAIDNENISVTNGSDSKSFSNFKDLLSQSAFPYQEIVQNKQIILHLIGLANEQLNQLRVTNPEAGGLIVATSVDHANYILKILAESFTETATVITYREDEPTKLIHQYRYSHSKWVISVGMISEGTNIPRMQVCCHLTNIKTEMHFRQILGRILRRTNTPNQEAFLYMPAEPKLVEYAYRVAQDVPLEADIVKFENMSANFLAKRQSSEELIENHNKKSSLSQEVCMREFTHTNSRKCEVIEEKSSLTSGYEKVMNIFGRFKQETLELSLISPK